MRVERWHRAVTFTLFAIVALVVGLWFVTPAAAQSDAGVIGQVSDDSGAVLPGVTVTATSPALQMPSVTVVTNEHGEYRLTPLPLGTYAVDYSLSGFQTVRREGLRLTVGFVAKVDVVLKVGALTETITVSGQSPVVDVTSPSTATRLTKENLELIPSNRNGVIGLMAQAPGVRTNLDVGGSTINSVPTFRAFGQNNEPWQQIEGVVTSTPKSGISDAGHPDQCGLEIR
jgi:carboxypeptidase family protein